MFMLPPRVTVWETYICVRIGTSTIQCPKFMRQNVYLRFSLGSPYQSVSMPVPWKSCPHFLAGTIWLTIARPWWIYTSSVTVFGLSSWSFYSLTGNESGLLKFELLVHFHIDFRMMAVHWISCETSMYMGLVLVGCINRSDLLIYNSWLHDMHGLLACSLKWKANCI